MSVHVKESKAEKLIFWPSYTHFRKEISDGCYMRIEAAAHALIFQRNLILFLYLTFPTEKETETLFHRQLEV